MVEGTMGKATEMRVHTQEENSQEIKEGVDPADKANNRQSMGTTKEKGSRETEVGRNSKVFVDIVGCKGIKHQIAPSRNKE
jgi:hypothetical protein